jgi:hypothetical protein
MNIKTPEQLSKARERFNELVTKLHGAIQPDTAPGWNDAEVLARQVANHCDHYDGQQDAEVVDADVELSAALVPEWTWPAGCQSLTWAGRLDFLRRALDEPMVRLRQAQVAPYVLWNVAADDARSVAAICAETVRAQDPAGHLVSEDGGDSYRLVIPGEES